MLVINSTVFGVCGSVLKIIINSIFVMIPAEQIKRSDLYEVREGAFFMSTPNGSMVIVFSFSPHNFMATTWPISCNSAAKNGSIDTREKLYVNKTTKKIMVGNPIFILRLLSIFHYRHKNNYKE